MARPLFPLEFFMPPSKKPAVNDPIEGAKLEQKGKPAPAADPAPGVIVLPAPEEAPSVAAPAAPAKPEKRYRVTRRTTVSHFGQMITLSVDDVISASGYGDVGLERLLSAVPTEEIV